MTVALCLYGHFRCFDDCWPELESNLIKPNGITDVFTMAWADTMGVFQHPESSTGHLSHPGYDPASRDVDIDYVLSIMSRLRPIRMHLDNYHLHDRRFDDIVDGLRPYHHPSIHHRPRGTLGQVWGRCASLAMAKEEELRRGYRYDRIICTRWDIAYSKTIDLNMLDQSVVSTDGMYGSDVISDAWTCGPSWAMDAWSKQFCDISELVSRGTMNLGPHEWLKAHFGYHEIPWVARPDVGIWIRR